MTRTLESLLPILVATLAAFPPARAQSSDAAPRINMTIGTPARAVLRDTAQSVTGTFARQAGDTLVLHRAAGLNDTTVFLHDIARLDEQAHPFNTPATRQGAIIGGAVGLVTGILVLNYARNFCRGDLVGSPNGCDFAYAVLPDFVAAGAGIGFGLTWVTEKPRWQVRWSAPLP